MITDTGFQLQLLLDCLRITCKYFKGDEEVCELSENYESKDVEFPDCHIACNCNGDIKRCDLPDKFQVCL